jgi:hypothetical protein
VKTKCVAGVEHLCAECFAYVGDPHDTSTWLLPLFFRGKENLTINHIKNALYRFASIKDIPDSARAEVLRTIQGAAKAHGIKAGPQPASVLPGGTRPETAKLLDADELELKAARAVGELAAERFLKQIGY